MNITIIDYIGVIKGGVTILMSWIINDEYFEFIFWFDEKNDYKIYTEDNLNNKLGINDIYEWCQLENFIIYLNSIIPPKKEIFNEFNIEFKI